MNRILSLLAATGRAVIAACTETGKIARFPIVFVGVDYWSGLFKWVEEKMLAEEHTISPDDLNLYRVVDTAEEAAEHIFRFYDKYVLKPNF